MLKVLIVDDEFLVRIGIKSCIEWDKYGFELVGVADDGIIALEMIKTLEPDIVLTDIKMPNMDGLELIEKAKRRFPETKFIVLSCYNEIESVKTAIKLGAEDYILKLSMEEETLLNVLTKTGTSIIKEKENNGHQLNKYKGANNDLLKETLYKNYLRGAIPFDKFRAELDGISAKPGPSYINTAIISCKIDDYASITFESKIEDKQLLKFSLINIIDSILNIYPGHEILEIDNGKYIIVIDFNRDSTENEIKKTLKDTFLKINSALVKYLNITVSLGITLNVNNAYLIKQKYFESSNALEHSFFSGKESLIFYDEITKFSDNDLFIDLEKEKELIFSLDNMDVSGLKSIVNDLIFNIHSPAKYSPLKIKIAIVEIFYIIMKNIKKHGIDMDNIINSENIHPVSVIMNSDTLIGIKNCFEQFINKLIDKMRLTGLNYIRPEILKLKKYILEHLSEPITLDKASEISNLSKSYLSNLFKKEMGINFLEYVNQLKMEKAKDILQAGKIKVREVANEVGILDEAYFSKLFKKYTSMSPKEFKALNRLRG